MAESPTPGSRQIALELLLPFCLIRIKALESKVAGQQTQLNELLPLQRTCQAESQELEQLRDAQYDLEERLSSEVSALSDHMTTLERCIEENDAKLNSVQTSVLQGRMEALSALDECLEGRTRQCGKRDVHEGGEGDNSSSTGGKDGLATAASPRRDSRDDTYSEAALLRSCCESMLEQQRRADAMLEVLRDRISAESAAVEERCAVLEQWVEDRLLRRFGDEIDGEALPPVEVDICSGAPQQRLTMHLDMCRVHRDEFDDDVGEGERPVPIPKSSRRPCVSLRSHGRSAARVSKI
jgi:hypothetical protein